MYRSIYSLNMDTELRCDMEEVCKGDGNVVKYSTHLIYEKSCSRQKDTI